MNHTLTESTIALAAIFQAAQLVQEVSRQGWKINRACEASIHSIFMLDADSTDEIYDGIEGVQLGLQVLVDHLGENSKNRRDIELTRYLEKSVEESTDFELCAPASLSVCCFRYLGNAEQNSTESIGRICSSSMSQS